MDDNRIEIVASLDIPKTVSTIKDDLKKVADQLNSDQALKIACGIDVKNINVKEMQQSLNAVAQKADLKLDIKSTLDKEVVTRDIDVIKKSLQRGDEGSLKKLSDALEQVRQETIAVAQAAKEVKYPQIAISGNTKDTLVNAKETLNQFFNTEGIDGEANRVKRAIEDTTGELQRFYVQVERGDKSVETLTYAINAQGNAYEYLGKTIREADNSTDFRRKGLDVQKQIQIENLDKFIAQVEKSGVATDDLTDRVSKLREGLNNINDTSSMNAFLDDFDVAKAKYQALTAEQRKFNAEQRAISKDITLENKIKTLATDMESYANANKKAVKSSKEFAEGVTFAQKWADLIQRATTLAQKMANGFDVSADEAKHLNEEFRAFKSAANANEVAGNGFFASLSKGFKTIGTYITAQRVISSVTNEIRSAVTELKNMDDILTEISKTSGRTEESLRTLGESSFDVASTYGRTASDYLLGVQEMSRAGFGEKQSEDLAELSLRAQAAGDMTAEMANQYIIATNAAYGLEGNIDALNKVLDSQNYITNRNALNMENLSEATKIAASQASASGVAIDELTAAVGTMVATTQQGGNIAGRALKGILMNIQQVKADAADIGDGGEAITTESLSKYESATKALGVSLKEVKNGVWALRDPMQVLKELSEAVRKESEDSVKVANLISSVGGKYRGNQLIALLENWDTYEKMLAEFNSEEAVGSAAEEAAKSANNWAGSINQVKNSWSELVNQFINSDNAITIIQTLNDIIQDLTDSAATGTLKVLANLLTDIVKTLGVITDKVGALPALISAIYTVRYLKSGKGIFGTVVDNADNATKHITLFNRELQSGNTKGLTGIINALKSIKLQAIGAEVAASALNAALTMGLSFAVSGIISKVSELVHAEENAAREAERIKKEQAELRERTLSNFESYNQEKKELQNLVTQYVNLSSSLEDTEASKKELLALQDQVVEKYGKEKDAIDLVNKSLEENIQYMIERREQSNKQWARDNASGIDAAKEFFEQYRNESPFKLSFDVLRGEYGLSQKQEDLYDEALTESKIAFNKINEYLKKNYSDIYSNFNIIAADNFEEGQRDLFRSFEIKTGLSFEEQTNTIKALTEAYQEYFLSLKSNYGSFDYASILDNLTAQNEAYSQNYDILKSIKSINEENDLLQSFEGDEETYRAFKNLLSSLIELNAQYNDTSLNVAERYSASVELADTVDQLKAIAVEYPVVSETIEASLQGIGLSFNNTSVTIESAKEVWLKSLDEAQKGVLSNVDKMIATMKKLASGDAVDSKSAWEIINLDDTGILSDIKLDSNGNYIFSLEQIIRLKDTEIQKEIDLRNESIKTATEQKKLLEDNIILEQRNLDNLIARRNALVSSGINSAGDARRVSELDVQISSLKNAIDADTTAMQSFNYTIKNESLYVDELTSKMGGLIDSSEMLEAQIKAMQKEVSKLKDEVSKLNTEAEARLKAQEHAVDEIIDKLQDEVGEMEKGKTALEDQLKILEEQKENLEEIVNNYKTAGDVVDNTINKQIEEIEENRKQVEDYYNNLIDKLKQENDEREDALELQQKLDNLENAKNNKVRVYDAARGWSYEEDKDAVQKAQNELDEYKNSQAIKALEVERDKQLKGYDDQIDGFERYAKEWKAVIEGIENAENERIAEEILGSDWREKIKSKDTNILGKYKTNYASYTTQLKTLTNNEIKYLNDSIKAKEKEIETKKKQIQVWNDYKTEISNAAKEVKDKLEEYNKYLNEVEISENSTNDARVQNLETFKTKYSNLIDEISKKNSQIENTEKQITSLTNAMNKLNEVGNSVTTSSTPVMGGIANGAAGALAGSGVFEAIISALQEAFNKLKTSIPHFAKGGSAGFTGFAWMDGAPNSTETVFTAAQSKKLYDYVNNMPEFSRLFGMNPNLLKGKTTNNSSSVTIGQMTVMANNPQEFATQFRKQMSTYLQTELTKSQIY